MKKPWMILALLSANLGVGVFLFSFFFPAGCGQRVNSELRTVEMKLGTRTFTLEVADSEATRRRGLMQRDSMPTDHGMIFVFPEDDRLSFWMKDTRIPLDIIYVNSQEKVVSIHQMEPYDLGSTPSEGPARYAIELNKGMAQRTGLKPGDAVSIPSNIKVPSPEIR